MRVQLKELRQSFSNKDQIAVDKRQHSGTFLVSLDHTPLQNEAALAVDQSFGHQLRLRPTK